VYQGGQNLEGDALQQLKVRARKAGVAAWEEQLVSTALKCNVNLKMQVLKLQVRICFTLRKDECCKSESG